MCTNHHRATPGLSIGCQVSSAHIPGVCRPENSAGDWHPVPSSLLSASSSSDRSAQSRLLMVINPFGVSCRSHAGLVVLCSRGTEVLWFVLRVPCMGLGLVLVPVGYWSHHRGVRSGRPLMNWTRCQREKERERELFVLPSAVFATHFEWAGLWQHGDRESEGDWGEFKFVLSIKAKFVQ